MSTETAPLAAVRVEPVVRGEWGFLEPPEDVDLQRLWNEAKSASVVMFYSYMEQLYKNAPKTYARLRDWRMSKGCTLFNCGYDPHGRFTSNAVLSGAANEVKPTNLLTLLIESNIRKL